MNVRFLLSVDGKLRQLARFFITNRDTSLYIVPYSINRRYLGGEFDLGNGLGPFETKVDLSEAKKSLGFGIPHVSLHESGLVQVRDDSGYYGRIKAPALPLLINKHIASLSIDSFQSLPILEQEPDLDRSKRKFDVVVPIKGKVKEPVRFPIIVNSQRVVPLMDRCLLELGVPRKLRSLPPIRYCLGYRDDKTYGQQVEDEVLKKPGITVIAGWDVFRMDEGEPTKFLVLRGE